MPYSNQFDREVECLTIAIQKAIYPEPEMLNVFREAVSIIGFQNLQGIMTEFKLSLKLDDKGQLVLESQAIDKLAMALNIEAFMTYVIVASYTGRIVY